jgi:hypothetical protein
MINTLTYDFLGSCNSNIFAKEYFNDETPSFVFESEFEEQFFSNFGQSKCQELFLKEETEEELNQVIYRLSKNDKNNSSKQPQENNYVNDCNNKEKNLIFKVNYTEKERENYFLFIRFENQSVLDEYLSGEEEKYFINKKRSKVRVPRYENQDNIRKKIKRAFLNNALINKLNEKIKSSGSRLFFEKFPQKFVCDIIKKSNKEILNMTLFEIFEKKDLYGGDLANYYHNLKVIKSDDFKENQELKFILNKTYCELFEEYLKSYEYIVEEINRLKEKNMGDDYVKKYIYLAKHFIEYFSQ